MDHMHKLMPSRRAITLTKHHELDAFRAVPMIPEEGCKGMTRQPPAFRLTQFAFEDAGEKISRAARMVLQWMVTVSRTWTAYPPA